MKRKVLFIPVGLLCVFLLAGCDEKTQVQDVQQEESVETNEIKEDTTQTINLDNPVITFDASKESLISIMDKDKKIIGINLPPLTRVQGDKTCINADDGIFILGPDIMQVVIGMQFFTDKEKIDAFAKTEKNFDEAVQNKEMFEYGRVTGIANVYDEIVTSQGIFKIYSIDDPNTGEIQKTVGFLFGNDFMILSMTESDTEKYTINYSIEQRDLLVALFDSTEGVTTKFDTDATEDAYTEWGSYISRIKDMSKSESVATESSESPDKVTDEPKLEVSSETHTYEYKYNYQGYDGSSTPCTVTITLTGGKPVAGAQIDMKGLGESSAYGESKDGSNPGAEKILVSSSSTHTIKNNGIASLYIWIDPWDEGMNDVLQWNSDGSLISMYGGGTLTQIN